MDQIKEGLDQFITLLKESETYKNYEHQKELLFSSPELKRKVDDFRRRNFFLHNGGTNGDQIFEESDRLVLEMEEMRKNPQVHEFLMAELAYCKMIQDIMSYFSNAMFTDFE